MKQYLYYNSIDCSFSFHLYHYYYRKEQSIKIQVILSHYKNNKTKCIILESNNNILILFKFCLKAIYFFLVQ